MKAFGCGFFGRGIRQHRGTSVTGVMLRRYTQAHAGQKLPDCNLKKKSERKKVSCPLQLSEDTLPNVEDLKYLRPSFMSEGNVCEIIGWISGPSEVMWLLYLHLWSSALGDN